MERKTYTIRREVPGDFRRTEELTRDAFWNVYRPGCTEHYILHTFRGRSEFIPELSLVMEMDSEIIGHIMYTHSQIVCDNGGGVATVTFGPISISPRYQRRGYGRALLDSSLELAGSMGYGAVCIEGNIGFYGGSGFVKGSTMGIRYFQETPESPAPYFLVRELKTGYLNGVSGVYRPPEGYFIDEAEAERFDQRFPKREKLRLPGQLS